MLATSQSPDFSARRTTRDISVSPSCRKQSFAGHVYPYGSPLLIPSRPRLSRSQTSDSTRNGSPEDFFLQSPFKSPQPPIFDAMVMSHLTTTSQTRVAQSSNNLTSQTKDAQCPSTPSLRSSVGVKRKSATLTTPLRHHNLTPLKITATKARDGELGFERLVAPDSVSRTPRTTREVDMHVGHNAASLRKLKIADLNDSGCEMDDDSDCESPSLMATIPAGLGLRGRGSGEVAEAISPDGHISKRRARTRPISSELMESLPRGGSGRPIDKSNLPVSFPLAHTRRKSPRESPSSSEASSPTTRRRLSGMSNKGRMKAPRPSAPAQLASRAPFARVDSATLFFGPAVQTGDSRSRPKLSSSPRPQLLNRHSYGGSTDSITWRTIQTRSVVSPQSSPISIAQPDTDEDEDMLFNPISHDSSFSFSLTGSPSPRTTRTPLIAKKYKPRDSGVVVSDDDDIFMSEVPQASTSVSSIYSDGDGLVTPGVIPYSTAQWPFAPSIAGVDMDMAHADSVDVFIRRTLDAAATAPEDTKRIPGTPVKKVKTTARPWQSAVAQKVGIDWEGKKKGKLPRISLPAVLLPTGRKGGKALSDPSTDSEDEPDDSPSNRKYPGVGLGLPGFSGFPRHPWLSRRSSSGALSSGSDSMSSIIGTPSRKGAWSPMDVSPSIKVTSPRTTSSSSTSTLNSPTALRTMAGGKLLHQTSRSSLGRYSRSPSISQFGRFERDFIQIGEAGSGEFGQVIKVRSKDGSENEVFAVKKSKRFEGVKHRIRLREEVDILQHLSNINGGDRHPNVLAFIDSWEEGDVLYIRTELCEAGNLARFLWEYGRVFPRLEEARVWKIAAELSSGLRFIHDAGVIHLDLKPANVFLTKDGRFKIGDFGMASIWPPITTPKSFEREGDKLYLAPEVLQGRYGKAADVFSFGMTILETAANIVVPDQGEAWHRLRQEDFVQVDLEDSPELFDLIQRMMRTDPASRIDVQAIYHHPIVSRARTSMERELLSAKKTGIPSKYAGSPLATLAAGFLDEILGRPISNGGVEDVNRGVSRAF